MFFIFVVCTNHENIFTTKISRSMVLSILVVVVHSYTVFFYCSRSTCIRNYCYCVRHTNICTLKTNLQLGFSQTKPWPKISTCEFMSEYPSISPTMQLAAIIRSVTQKHPTVQLSRVMKKCARKGHVSSAEELYKFSPKPEDHPFILMVGLNLHKICWSIIFVLVATVYCNIFATNAAVLSSHRVVLGLLSSPQ